MRVHIDWVSLIARSKFTVFPLYLRTIFQVQAPGGLIFWRDDLTEGFSRHWFGGLIFGGAYFRNFTGNCTIWWESLELK